MIDCGEGISHNATIAQRDLFPATAGNFCDPGNVVYFSAESSPETTTNDPQGDPPIIGTRPNVKPEPNATLIGKLDATGLLAWTRPTGLMRLEVINANGNQSVCPPLVVAAGKTYVISLRCGQSTIFDVKVKPESIPR